MIKLTDQYFTYREYPLDYDGAGKVYLKGNSIGWNQLRSPIVGSSTPSGITGTFTADGKCVFTGTSTGANVFVLGRNIPMNVNHKYLILFNKTLDANRNIQLRYSTDGTTDSGGYLANIYNSTIFTYTNSTYPYVLLRFYFGNGVTLNDTFYISMYDLTMIFGSGKEPSSVSEFKQYYPLNYYTYTQGTLVNFNGTGIKTTGKNQLNPSDAVNSTATVSYSDDVFTVAYTSSGTRYVGMNFYRTGIPTDKLLPKKYTLSFDISGIDTTWVAGLRTVSANNFVSGNQMSMNSDGHYSLTIDLEANNQTEHYISWSRTGNLTTPVTVHLSNVLLEIGETETSYEPYQEHTTSLPTLTYFPTGMKSAGSVYDEITGSKAITRVGSVDLGSLTWTRTTSYTNPFFYTNMPTGCKYFYNDTTPNATSIYSVYQVKSASVFGQNAPNKSFTIYSYGNQLFVRDDAYTDASAFASAMSGVYLNYELSSYSEAEVNDDFIYLGYANGTEQLLPINGATPTTSPLFADIEYYTLMDAEIPYRKFWLINNSNEQWDLTEKDFKAFLNNPTGLGFKKTIEMTRYGEKAVKNNETYDFPSVQGELLFYDSANSNRYDKYNQFVRFIMDTPLKLYYQIPVSISSQIADIYSLDCEITQLDKTESKPDRLMRCNVTFSGLGFWEGDEVTISGSGLSYTIENKGDFPVGFEITFEGNFSNPYFTLEQDGELYGECKFDDSQNTFSNVYVNSNDGEQDIVLKQSGTILPNPLSYQDLSISNGNIYVTFVKLAKGTTTLTIGAGTVQTNAEIKYTPAYRSV